MTEPIRLLHFADYYLGTEDYGPVDASTGLSLRVMDYLHALDEVIDDARYQHEPDLVIFCGGIFKSPKPPVLLWNQFYSRLHDLARICPVVLVQGFFDTFPHDHPDAIPIADTPSILLGTDYRLYTIETRRGPVVVATAPLPTTRRLLPDQIPWAGSYELTATLKQAAEHALLELAEAAAPYPMPRILAGSLMVEGAQSGAERAVLFGYNNPNISLSVVAHPAWDYVALGQMNRHQHVSGGSADRPPVVYSGSLEHLGFADASEPKGFIRAEVEQRQARWAFHEVHIRRLLPLRVDVRGSDDPTRVVLDALKQYNLDQAVVQVNILTDIETEPLLQKPLIAQALHDAQVSHFFIHQDIEHPTRARLGSSPGLYDDSIPSDLPRFVTASGGQPRGEAKEEAAGEPPAAQESKLEDALPHVRAKLSPTMESSDVRRPAPIIPPMPPVAAPPARSAGGPHIPLPAMPSLSRARRETAAPAAPPHFSAYYPSSLQPKRSYALMAFVHLESARDQVREVAAGFVDLMGGKQKSESAPSTIQIDVGSLITFVPQIPGLTFTPAEQVAIWKPPYQSVTFPFTTPADLKADLEGTIQVYHGPLIVGEIPVKMAVQVKAGAGKLDTESDLERFDPVFASYSHKDTPVMEYFRRARANMGQKMMVDVYDLRAGDHWAPRLLDMIEECAVFQLFWSRHSAQSTYCRQEWEHALACGSDRPRFIRPVWWEAPMPPPPLELADLHFQRVTVPAATRLQLSLARLKTLFGRR